MRLLPIALLLALPIAAQDVKLPASLDRLAAKATEVVDVTLDASMLQLASKFLSDKGDDAKAKKLVSGLKSIFVKSFEFDKAGEYDAADVESVRSQVRGPAWTRIVNVQSKKKGENAEIYIRNENGKIAGLTIIAAEPKELTIVNIVGSIDPEQLSDLGGHFGIPQMEKKQDKKLREDE